MNIINALNYLTECGIICSGDIKDYTNGMAEMAKGAITGKNCKDSGFQSAYFC
ncbi:MAG: hypothetical protein ACOCRZ_04275 [Halothermotrichaceae bacterium]